MNNLTSKIYLLIAGLLVTFTVSAQQITGVVKDTGGQPLAGVSVFIDGTTTGTSTDVDGKYAISVGDAQGKTLVFSFIGMRTQEVRIGNSSVYDIVMEDDSNFLEETVVIGYATVKRKDLIGSVSSVDSKALAAMPVTTVTEENGVFTLVKFDDLSHLPKEMQTGFTKTKPKQGR